MFISGIGAINACGIGIECLEMLKQNSNIKDGLISKDAFLSLKNKYDLRRADRYTSIVMASAVQASTDAGFLDCAQPDTGVIIVSAFGPHRTTFAFLNDILDYPEDQVLPTTFSHSVHNAAASYVASSLQIRGPAIAGIFEPASPAEGVAQPILRGGTHGGTRLCCATFPVSWGRLESLGGGKN